MPTADDTKCTGCGEPFVSGSGPYIRHGFDGLYHKRCLPHGPAPDQYRAGLIAGLREAEKIAYRAAMRSDTQSAVLNIRARIADLETEEGK